MDEILDQLRYQAQPQRALALRHGWIVLGSIRNELMWRRPLLISAGKLVSPAKGAAQQDGERRQRGSSPAPTWRTLQVFRCMCPNVAHVLQKPVHICKYGVDGAWCTECHLPKLGASARQSTDETLRRQRPSPKKHFKTRDGRPIRHAVLRG